MTGTSTAKALWEASCKCVPSDTQVWTLENATGFLTGSIPATGGLPLMCCGTSDVTTGETECSIETFNTDNPLNVPFVCGTINCNNFAPNTPVLVNCFNVAFRNYDCRSRCWADRIIANIAPNTPGSGGAICEKNIPFPPTIQRPCRLYLTAGSWLSTAIIGTKLSSTGLNCPTFPATVTPPVGSSAVKVEILKALNGIINCFVSCGTLCNAPVFGNPGNVGAIPDTLVDTSILLYAFHKGGFCDNYFDSNGDPIRSAAQFVRDVLAGEDILFDCTSPVNTGDCGCLCANESAVTINLCDYPCLASRLICTEKLVWTLNSYINCHRPRSCCGTCFSGTV